MIKKYLVKTESYRNTDISSFDKWEEAHEKIMKEGIQYRNMGCDALYFAEIEKEISINTDVNYDKNHKHITDYIEDDNIEWVECNIQRYTEATNSDGEVIENMVCDYGDGGDDTPMTEEEWKELNGEFIIPDF